MGTLWSLYLRELRSTLRERNVLLYVLVVPLLLYPFLLWLAISAATLMAAQEEQTPVRIVIRPPQAQLARALEQHRVTVVDSPDPQQDLRKGVIDAILDLEQDAFRLTYDGRYRQSRRAQQRLRPLLSSYREIRLEEMALENGVTLQELQPIYVKSHDEGTSSEQGRYIMGVFLPLCLLVVLSLGGLYPAVETFAGEHERLTLDTTLMLCVPRWKIIVSKYALVASLCFLSGVCNLLAVTISLRPILQPLNSTFASSLSWGWSLYTLLIIVVGILAMSLLVAAITLLFTAHTRTFRQGQAATTPLFMAILIPCGALVDRSLTLNAQTSWIPVLNVALLWRDSLSSQVGWELTLGTLCYSVFWVLLCLGLLTWRLRGQSRALGLTAGNIRPQ